MVLIGWMLCLCGFFLSQDFTTALCLLIAFALLVVALIQFHRGASPGAVWPPVGTMCKLLLQASPLVVIFFSSVSPDQCWTAVGTASLSRGKHWLFRSTFSWKHRSSCKFFRDRFPRGVSWKQHSAVWSDVLARDSDVALQRHGMASSVRAAAEVSSTTLDIAGTGGLPVQSPNAKEIQQRITLAPHGARWMFALDHPIKTLPGAMLARGDYLSSVQPIRKARRYEVVSLESSGNEITAKERAESLEVPASISPAVRDLAHSWTVQNRDSRGVISSALQFFRTQGFSYSLTPGEYDDLEEFLFRRRVGFCEHYATSFATLMRLAGIPARVVVGYLGGEYNDLGHFFLVRQADAHAWCEVWLPEKGWTRVDPTSAVAPGRTSFDLTTFLETSIASGQMGVRRNALIAQLLRSAVFTNVRFIWQTLSYEWDTRLLAFDADVQDVLLTSMGIASRGMVFLVVEILLVAIALLAIYFAWMQLRTRSRVDRVKALYEYFCRKIARLGVPRDPCEGPLDFARRAAQSLPNESNRIRQIADSVHPAAVCARTCAGNARQICKGSECVWRPHPTLTSGRTVTRAFR